MEYEKDLYPVYREVQYFRQVWLWILVLGISGISIYGGVQQLILGKPFGNNPASDAGLVVIVIIFGFIFPVFFYFMNLTTEVHMDGIYLRFFPIHLSFHRIAFQDLKRFEARSYSPLKEYGGWGIRYGRKGKAYDVSGNRGVQLELSKGSRLLIGSQKPEELAEAITMASKGKLSDVKLSAG